MEKKAAESTSAIVYDEKIRFGVIERSRQVKLTPKANGSSPYSYNPIRLEPTGILSIEVWNYYSGGPQKIWRDRESARIEEQLPKCVAGMMRIALKERADEQARNERELARQKKIDEVAAELEKIEAEEKKVRVLRREVAKIQPQRHRLPGRRIPYDGEPGLSDLLSCAGTEWMRHTIPWLVLGVKAKPVAGTYLRKSRSSARRGPTHRDGCARRG